MAQLATSAVPPSQIVYRQLLNMRSALRSQGHDPLMADHVMRAEVTRFIAEQAMESTAGPEAERALAIAAIDGHLAMRGRAITRQLTPEAQIRKFEHEIAIACTDRCADAQLMGVMRGVAITLLCCAVFDAVGVLGVLWSIGSL